jgi:FkbM family methyltransferase
LWDYLKRTSKPIVLYGTGNACERIIEKLNAEDVEIAGIFASDTFIRDRYFAGFKLMTYDEAKAKFGDMTVLLCFGTDIPEVIENIKRITAEQELYAPDLPVAGEGFFTRAYAQEHRSDILWLNKILADETGCKVLADVLSYKQSGNIDYLFGCESDDDENWSLLQPSADDVYMDLGAYTGDTVRRFIRLAGGFKRIIAVEPEERNFRKLFENTKELENIELVNAAVGDVYGEILFTRAAGKGSAKGKGGAKGKGKTAPVIQETVDRLVDAAGIVPTFIKMDLEGAERGAINGAAGTIKKYGPRLIIAAYHRIDDLWSIPKLLISINPDYKIYLRKSPCLPAWEVNFYCSTEEL